MKNLNTKKINNNAKSYLAKLLATENISVEHKKVQTAYFDVKSRLLVLPIWKHMNNDITDLLIEDRAYSVLFSRKFDEELENTLRTMRAEAFVEYKDLDLSLIHI